MRLLEPLRVPTYSILVSKVKVIYQSRSIPTAGDLSAVKDQLLNEQSLLFTPERYEMKELAKPSQQKHL